MNQYRIIAEPEGAINANKDRVTYRIEGAEGQHIRWRTRHGERARVLYYLSEYGHSGPEGEPHWTTKWYYPGNHEVIVEVMTKEGTLGFGEEWRPIASLPQQVKADLSWVDAYRIVAVPPLRSITPDTELKFHVERTVNDPAFPAAEDLQVRWYRLNYADDSEREMQAKLLHGGFYYAPISFKGNTPGHHRVLAEISHKHQRKVVIEFPQEVISMDQVLKAGPIRPLSKEDLKDPEIALRTSKNELEVLGILEQKQSAMPKDKQEEYAQYKELRQAFIEKLEQRLESTQGKRRFPVKAQYYSSASTEWSPLQVFVSPMNASATKWCLVDWTQPTNQSGTSETIGEGRTPKEALINAFGAWDTDNRYPPGAIQFEFDHPSNNISLRHSFKTDGESDGDTLANILSWIGLGAAVVAGVVTLVAPVPGSRVASAAIWSSIFSSSAASAIKIGQRYDEGFSNAKDDGLDALTIIGNIFTAGTAGRALNWARGANVTIQNNGRVIRYALIGEISTEASQGVLIGMDYYDAFIKISEDANLTPKERLDRLMQKSVQLAGETLLTTFNFKASKSDLSTLNATNKYFNVGESPATMLADLKVPGKMVDLTKPKAMEGNTSTGKHVTTVGISRSVVTGKGGGGAGSGGNGGKGGGGNGKGGSGNPPGSPKNPHPGLHNQEWDEVSVPRWGEEGAFRTRNNYNPDHPAVFQQETINGLSKLGYSRESIDEIMTTATGFKSKQFDQGDVVYSFDTIGKKVTGDKLTSKYMMDEQQFSEVKEIYYRDGHWDKEGVKNYLALPCFNRVDSLYSSTVKETHNAMQSTTGLATENITYQRGTEIIQKNKAMFGGGPQTALDLNKMSEIKILW